MSIKTIGILMPGDMGHGCGKFFLDNKLSVITALDGRSNLFNSNWRKNVN